MRRRDVIAALGAALALVARSGAEPAPEPTAEPKRDASKDGAFFDVGEFGKSKEPITVAADTLEYNYKGNIVVYRGDVQATQGKVRLRSDTLTVVFTRSNTQANGADAEPAKSDVPPKSNVPDPTRGSTQVQEVVAAGNVRIDQETKWATGGKAVFDQGQRTLVLTDNPVLHDGPNEVVGDRVVVYLDEDRSVVEGGRKRVKAVLYPGSKETESAGKPKARETVARP